MGLAERPWFTCEREQAVLTLPLLAGLPVLQGMAWRGVGSGCWSRGWWVSPAAGGSQPEALS